ncbi:MAG TPA: hypothetical protein VHM24_07115, partial [Gemmatimonadaceae bacterium]|nr:hypothetical protein [Gemmatimonadaceae bacterium]
VRIHVSQTVAKIVIDSAALLVESLGARHEIPVLVLDDLGQVVTDTSLVVEVVDPQTVRVESADSAGITITSLSNGTAMLRVGVGDVVTQVPVLIEQRPFAVEVPSAITFDALGDTATLAFSVRDSAGSRLEGPRVRISSTDTAVARVDGAGVVSARRNGVAHVVVRASATVADSTRIVVAQRPVGLWKASSEMLLEALGATRTSGIQVVDRGGSPVLLERRTYYSDDTTTATVDSNGTVTARGNGVARVTARWMEDSATITVNVRQRAWQLVPVADSVLMTALGDTVVLQAAAYDSLGSLVADPGVTATSVDSVVRIDRTRVVATTPGRTSVILRAGTAEAAVQVRVVQSAASIDLDVDSTGVIVLDAGSRYPLRCSAVDRNGYAIQLATVMVKSARARRIDRCDIAAPVASGIDTLTFTIDGLVARRIVAIALRPQVNTQPMPVPSDSFAAGAGQWAPSVVVRDDGVVELYHAAYARDDSSGRTYSNLNRLRSTDGGRTFANDGIALSRSADPCAPDGWGIENVAILPRIDAPGYRMLYASGSYCLGWSVKSAVSPDGRTWEKEPGVRIGDPVGAQGPAFSAGEGMTAIKGADGTWRLWAGVYVYGEGWGIEEWRSLDQLNWSRYQRVFTPQSNPIGDLGAIYSPSIQQIAPALWRMFFSGDRRGNPGGQSRIYSAVSRNLTDWIFEGVVLEDPSTHFWYAAALGNRLFFLTQPVGREDDFAPRLAGATLVQP